MIRVVGIASGEAVKTVTAPVFLVSVGALGTALRTVGGSHIDKLDPVDGSLVLHALCNQSANPPAHEVDASKQGNDEIVDTVDELNK